jgi:mono/diheme cytochrome c family protein
MPVFAGILTDQEVENVVAYLKTGWEPRQLEVQKGMSGR